MWSLCGWRCLGAVPHSQPEAGTQGWWRYARGPLKHAWLTLSRSEKHSGMLIYSQMSGAAWPQLCRVRLPRGPRHEARCAWSASVQRLSARTENTRVGDVAVSARGVYTDSKSAWLQRE